VKKIASQPVKYVVNTHHADHSGGNRAMQNMDVEVVSSEQARENMVDAKQPGLPTLTFKHDALIHLGGKTVELYQFGRAHTNGDVVVYFPADRALDSSHWISRRFPAMDRSHSKREMTKFREHARAAQSRARNAG